MTAEQGTDRKIRRFAELLRDAERIMLFTGAGISTGSGIPDFRGPQGVWKKRKPVYFADFMRSEVHRVAYWRDKLEGWREFRDAQANATHHAAVALEAAGKLRAIVTQNIDGLHVLAGSSPGLVTELHGTHQAVACMTCDARSHPQSHFDAFGSNERPPVCACGGFLKPATISFGQALRGEDLEAAAMAAETCDLVVAMGSTLSVHPAASFPLLATGRGVPYVIVNRGRTDHDDLPVVTLRLEGDVAEIFPRTVQAALENAQGIVGVPSE